MSIINDKHPEIQKQANTTILSSKINNQLNIRIHNKELKNNFGTIKKC